MKGQTTVYSSVTGSSPMFGVLQTIRASQTMLTIATKQLIGTTRFTRTEKLGLYALVNENRASRTKQRLQLSQSLSKEISFALIPKEPLPATNTVAAIDKTVTSVGTRTIRKV